MPSEQNGFSFEKMQFTMSSVPLEQKQPSVKIEQIICEL